MSRKTTIFLLLVCLIAIPLSGCNYTEIDYYNVQKEYSNLKTFQIGGEFRLQVSNLPVMEDSELRSLHKLMSQGLDLEYTSKCDLNKQELDFHLYYKNSSTSKKEITRVIFKDDVLYVKMIGIVNYLCNNGFEVEGNKLYKALNGSEYLCFSQEEYFNALTNNDKALQFAYSSNNIADQKELNKLALRFFDGLIENVYKNYKTNLVSKSGNKFVIKMNNEELSGFISSFAKHTINNIDQLEEYLVSFIDSMTVREMNLLNLKEQQKEEAIVQILFFTQNIRDNKDELLAQIDANVIGEFLNNIIKDWEVSSTLEKKGSDTYESSFNLKADVPLAEQQINISSFDTTSVCEPFNLTIPTRKVERLQDFIDRNTIKMEIAFDSGKYNLTGANLNKTGKIEFKTIEGRKGIPFRYLAEAFGEQLGWDDNAYIVRDGKRIDLLGAMIIDGRTYLRTSELEELGYSVTLNEQTRTIVITRMMM